MEKERQELQKIMQYFRLCYTADNRELNLFDFHKKAEKPYFLSNADLLEGKMDQNPVNTAWAKDTLKELTIYTKEKTLVVGAFFIAGSGRVNGKRQKYFSPLVLYPANIAAKSKDLYVLTIEKENAIINYSALRHIDHAGGEKEEPLSILSGLLPEGKLGFDEAFHFGQFIEKYYPKIDASGIDNYPDVMTAEDIEKYYQTASNFNKPDSFKVLPALGAGIILKSRQTRGVLNELERIASGDVKYSVPLQTMFHGLPEKYWSLDKGSILVPTVLNLAQENVIRAMEKYPVSLVIGPPGTGKSFTIAGLAIHAMSKGLSVLIVSGNNQAVDVIADKIELDYQLREVCVRAGQKNYLRTLKKRLENMLSGIYGRFHYGRSHSDSKEVRILNKQVRNLIKFIKKLEDVVRKREALERDWGKTLTILKPGLVERFKRWLIELRYARLMPYWTLILTLENSLEEKNQLVKSLVAKRFNDFLNFILENHKDRNHLKDFLAGIRARTGGRQDNLFNSVDFGVVLKTLPIWLVSVTDISRVLPLRHELFDVLIFDEATQCDIASALPVLKRGKKVVIAGDPRQLRHISFLSKARQKSFREQLELDSVDHDKLNFRENSLLDLALASVSHQSQINFLNEHYRSHPDIIRFSNKEFYDDTLSVMTETPSTSTEKAVSVYQTNGKRSKTGYNKIEAEAILEKVKSVIDSEKNIDPKLCQSIGVLSPFRDQVNYLRTLISKELTLINLERHRILIGTAHSFQGEERDVMFLSFVVDNDTHNSVFRFLNRDDVFNVSITRARSTQHIFVSATLGHFPTGLFRKYIESVAPDERLAILEKEKNQRQDPFLKEVIEALEQLSPEEIYVNYPIAGLEIDIVVLKNGKTFCVDLIGYPGIFEPAFPLERYKMLNRVGVLVFPLPYSSWVLRREEALKELSSFIEG